MTKKQSDIILQPDAGLFNELSLLIEQSQTRLQSYANSTLTTLFWQVGKRINGHLLKHQRAEYGKEIVSTVSTQLKEKFGKNFELRNVRRMMQFSDVFPDYQLS